MLVLLNLILKSSYFRTADIVACSRKGLLIGMCFFKLGHFIFRGQGNGILELYLVRNEDLSESLALLLDLIALLSELSYQS